MSDTTRRTVLAGLVATAAISSLPVRAQNVLSMDAVLRDPDVPVLGNPGGNVTLVEFFDYQCPYCKSSHPDIVKLVADDGNVRHVMKDWPIFGAPSLYASRLALAAGRDHPRAVAALMDTLARLDNEMVDAALRKARLDPKSLWTAYTRDRRRIDAVLARNGAQAEAFGFMGTPAYIAGTTIFAGVAEPAALRAAFSQARG